MEEINKNNDVQLSWLLAIITAASYPYLLKLFSWSIENSNSLLAIISMGIMFSVPALALWSLIQIRNNNSGNPAALRTLLYLLVATSPLYIVTMQISGWVGLIAWHKWLWIFSILVLGFFLKRSSGNISKYNKSLLPYILTQKIHRICAILLIFGFISLHLSNHLFALHSNAAHEEIRLFFNSWYQAELIEAILFTLLAFMAITGLLMVKRYSGTEGNIFRTLQISSGLYMVIFLMAHINAVLSARSRSVETDWIFATGENGLINGSGLLIPYYILSVLMIILHISLGVRRILLSRKLPREKANKTFYALISAGSIFTVITSAAVLGLKV